MSITYLQSAACRHDAASKRCCHQANVKIRKLHCIALHSPVVSNSHRWIYPRESRRNCYWFSSAFA